ncbi:hypothetical protein QBC44DRAFT_23152 [Cladorrhinum sp. PSN332]|nr:hypothetical protein QBC44DRAFT_23152 [Cladorrhinum sp. PSN332]
MEQLQYPPRERPPMMEMRQKSRSRDSVFAQSSTRNRPNSVYTEFMESDIEGDHDHDHDHEHEDDEEVYSEFGDLEGIEEGECSPRASIGGSSGKQSFTTLSTYDEVQTPRSLRQRPFPFDHAFDHELKKPVVEGPRGPHLFRSSMSSAQSIELQHALTLSPLTPKRPQLMDFRLQDVHRTTLPNKRRGSGPFAFTDEELDTSNLPDWTPEMVAQRMLNAGVELPAAEKFVENDITGAILITLKFEDLKELGIPSFGVRTLIWEEIHSMRNMTKPEPIVPETPIEEEPDRQARRELRRKESSAGGKDKRKPRLKINDVISPLESVSIVGIEQVLPKPHQCSKGENCSKWKRNQRLMEAFKKDHPFVDDKGIIMLAGNLGNIVDTAMLYEEPEEDDFRPISDVVPSVVASSDVMGPGSLPPLQYLQEATLKSLQSRDPQDNVRAFLDFQHQHVESSEVPPTPPFEIAPYSNRSTPAPQTPHTGLRGLPKLAIPSQPAVPLSRRDPQSAQGRSARPISQVIPSFRELSPSSDEVTPTAPYRFGTPFSDMDVPVTMTAIPPVSRDFSQSVPPDMNYRHNPAPRSMSRNTIRRPSFPVMPALDENGIVSPVTKPMNRSFSQRVGQRPLQAPPRVQYPWTQTERPTLEKAVPPMPGSAAPAATGVASIKTVNIGGRLSPVSDKPTMDMTEGDAVSYQGLMKKRKTKMLRHEWHEHFFKLQGTRLTMHKDAATAAKKTLEYIDIDDYAIACSASASSKLNAAFKAMHIRRGSEDSKKTDVAAFSFQLIPQDAKGGVKLRKRDNDKEDTGSSNSKPAPPIEGAANGTGKTHHFAVKGRDERIDWMRELMLAKALKAKGDGFEISVNGNMI